MTPRSRQRGAPAIPWASSWVFGLLFIHLGVSPVLFSSATTEAFDYPKAALLQFVAMIALACLIVEGWNRGLRPPDPAAAWRADPLGCGMALFGISAVISTLFSISPGLSLTGAVDSFASLPTLLSGVVLFFATRAVCITWADARRLLVASSIGGTVAAGYALVQSAGLDVFAWNRVAERDFLAAFQDTVSFGTQRPFGTLGHSNTLGSFLAALLPLQVALAFEAHRRQRRIPRGLFALAAALSLLAGLRSASRAGWLGLAIGIVGVCVALVRVRRGPPSRFTRIVLVAVTLALGVGLVAAWDSEYGDLGWRLLGTNGLGSRPHLWAAALQLVRRYPFTGAGVDTFSLAYSGLRTPEAWMTEWNTTFARAHNEPLQLLATQGLLGGGSGMVILLGLGLSVRRAWSRVEADQRLTLASAFVALLGLVPQAMFGMLQVPAAVLMATLAACLSVAARDSETPGSQEEPSRWCPTLSLISSLLLLSVLFLNRRAWDGPTEALVATTAAFALPLIAILILILEHVVAPGPRIRPPSTEFPLRKAVLSTFGAIVIAIPVVLKPLAGDIASASGWRNLASDPRGALRSLEQAVTLAPGNAAHWARLGLGALRAAAMSSGEAPGLRQRALAAFSRAVELEPLEGQYRFHLCRVLTQRALAREAPSGEASRACDRAIDAEPANPYFYTAAVGGSVQLGDLARARRLVMQGLALYPHLGALQYQLGFINLSEGRLAEADTLFQSAVDAMWYGDTKGQGAARQALTLTRERLARQAP